MVTASLVTHTGATHTGATRAGPFEKAPGQLRPGRRVYAVGDVHGHAGRMDALHAAVARDLSDNPTAAGRPVDPVLVHLGDLVDRGPDSAGTVARLAAGSPLPGVPCVTLMGNHEWMMLDALANSDPDARLLWLQNGGDHSLRSWGVPARAHPRGWAAAVPPSHLAYLRDLPDYLALDGYLFVHAGVRPGVPLAEQRKSDLLWIREPFLEWTGPLLPGEDPPAAVHGHTPTAAPVVRAHRIGVDTGCAFGGPLSCAVLEGDQVRFLQA